MEGGFFELSSTDAFPEETLLEQLRLFQEEKAHCYDCELDVTMRNICFTERLAVAVMDIFGCYDARWHEIYFTDCDQNWHFSLVLAKVGAAFQNTRLDNRDGIMERLDDYGGLIEDMTAHTASALKHLLQNSPQFERLAIANYRITIEAAAILSEGLKKSSGASSPGLIGPRVLIFCVMFDQTAEGERQDSISYLADGLNQNKTLQSLTLSDGMLINSRLSWIVQALTGHPCLQELSLVYNEFGETTMVALQGLLSCPSCKLSHLDISGHSLYNRGFHLGPLIRGLQNNHSLQALDLSENWRSDDIIEDNQDKDIRDILIMLWQCPNLVSIDLSDNAIGNLGIFQNQVSTATDKKSRLRRLDLDDNLVVTNLFLGKLSTATNKKRRLRRLNLDDRKLVVKTGAVLSLVPLLERHPELGDLGQDFMNLMDADSFPPQVQHLMDMNRCGRVLLRDGSLPLSVWPLVLVKAINDTYLEDNPSRMANVIYHLLQGPAFVSRGHYL
jgi:hypothetical protein